MSIHASLTTLCNHESLGFNEKEGGLCFGFTMRWLEACILDIEDLFDFRVRQILYWEKKLPAIQLSHLSNTITAQYDTINGESIADFLNRLRNQFYESKTIHLILDRSGYHRSETVAKEAKNSA